MKRSRFSEEQIVGVLREHEAGAKPDESLPPTWYLECSAYTPFGETYALTLHRKRSHDSLGPWLLLSVAYNRSMDRCRKCLSKGNPSLVPEK
jgi:hypothetical protein